MTAEAAPIIEGYVPGAIGRVAEMHATYYHRHWGFGLFFETRVASELGEFMERRDPRRDGFWTVSPGGRVEGTITIDAANAEDDGAHLRWFIVSDALRGQGVGRRLLSMALEHCREQGYPRAYLWTFKGLDGARHLYERAGFRLVHEAEGEQWGTCVTEQRFEWAAPSA